jgi:hypothetical protein
MNEVFYKVKPSDASGGFFHECLIPHVLYSVRKLFMGFIIAALTE